MQSTSSTAEKSQPRNLILGYGIILLVLAVVVGAKFLPKPYFAISQVVFYVAFLTAVGSRVRTCNRLAKSSGQSLMSVVIWFTLGVIAVLGNLADVIQSDNRNYITIATDTAMLLALYCALGIMESLMRKLATDVPPGARGEAIQPAGKPHQEIKEPPVVPMGSPSPSACSSLTLGQSRQSSALSPATALPWQARLWSFPSAVPDRCPSAWRLRFPLPVFPADTPTRFPQAPEELWLRRL